MKVIEVIFVKSENIKILFQERVSSLVEIAFGKFQIEENNFGENVLLFS